ncbi:MAG: B12-binding domain-containing radical SAM protein [Planctomycetes bacterium]|nr:B12-binding domain-containing radical SAM protein [Planctomycetota bacterium]
MKIAFLAMSGIRAHDPELLELGLTLPGFVERSRQVAALPSLGLLYLAAVTPAGHELAYYEAEGDGSEPEEVYAADLVAISTFSAQAFEAYAIADRLRARGVKVALGGLHVSALPEEAARHADYVVIGEGEHVWPRVVALAAANAPGRILDARDFAPVDVAALPVPRYDLLGARPYNRYTVQTARGCPWRCEFCASTVMLRERYRRRPVAEVVRDVEAILALAPDAFLELADDNTFVDKEWGKELCRALAPLGLKWFTETDVSVADDPELLELMAAAGCRQVLVGLEAPGAAGLAGLEQRADFKRARAAGYADAIARIQEHGVTVNGCFVLGLDGHGPEVFDAVYDFAERTALYEVQITYLTAFPGTPLYTRLAREGRLIEPERWDLCTLFDVNYRPLGMSVDALRAGMRDLSRRLYTAEALERRRAPFRARRRARRAS